MTETVICEETGELQSNRPGLRKPGVWSMWMFAVGLLLLAVIVTIAIPVCRRHRAIAAIERMGGGIHTRQVGYSWLRQIVGNRWIRSLETVESVKFLGIKPLSNTDLAWLLELPEIESLSFGNPMVDERGGRPFFHSIHHRGTPNRHPRITDDGMRYVKELKNLGWLSLSETQVGDSGLEQLAGLTKLRFLSLDLTLVTDGGLTHLCGMKNLIGLSLFRVAVTDTAIPELKCLPQLQHLYFHRVGDPEVFPGWLNEKMFDGGVGLLKRSNPRLQVHYGPGTDEF